MESFDPLDYSILQILKNNCRITVNDLAEQLDAHPNTISTRIKKLEDKEIILKYTAELNYRKLGYNTQAIFYLSIRSGLSVDAKAISDILDVPGIQGIGTLTGSFNLAGFIIAKDITSLDQRLKKLASNENVLNMKYELIINTYKRASTFNPLQNGNSKNHDTETKIIKLSEKDILIINELIQNGKSPYSEISEKHNIPISTIKLKIEKMLKEGIITRFNTNIDYTKLGYAQASFINIKLAPDSGDEDSIMKKILEIPEIMEMHSTTGDYNFVILLMSRSNIHLCEILEKFNKIPEILKLEVNTSYKRHIPRNNTILLDD